MITALARWTVPSLSVTSLMSPVRSTETTSSSTISAPKRSAWALMLSMRSGPSIPVGNPGKFSTSVVVVSEPPTKIELPNSRGLSWARAV